MLDIVWLTIRLAAVTTAVLLLLATPLAWWLARTRRWWSDAVLALTALPIVLPPTVIGFYLLVLLGPQGPFTAVLALFGLKTLAFTFPGLVVGSVVYSLPFAVQPIRNAFRAIGEEPLEAARVMGASPWQTFSRVALPLARPGLLTAAILVFAHTVGEFGIVLMVGGAVPGRTKVLSTEIYEMVESLRWGEAHLVCAALVAFAFATLLSLLLVERAAHRRVSEGVSG